jgi:hypothetical protein
MCPTSKACVGGGSRNYQHYSKDTALISNARPGNSVSSPSVALLSVRGEISTLNK